MELSYSIPPHPSPLPQGEGTGGNPTESGWGNKKHLINHGVKLVIYSTDAEKTLHSLIHIIEKLDEELIDIDLNAPSLTEVFESLITNK